MPLFQLPSVKKTNVSRSHEIYSLMESCTAAPASGETLPSDVTAPSLSQDRRQPVIQLRPGNALGIYEGLTPPPKPASGSDPWPPCSHTERASLPPRHPSNLDNLEEQSPAADALNGEKRPSHHPQRHPSATTIYSESPISDDIYQPYKICYVGKAVDDAEDRFDYGDHGSSPSRKSSILEPFSTVAQPHGISHPRSVADHPVPVASAGETVSPVPRLSMSHLNRLYKEPEGPKTIAQRLAPTLQTALAQRDTSRRRARTKGWILNIAIGTNQFFAVID